MCGIFGMIRCSTAKHPERASAAFVELGHLSIERGRDAAGFALSTCDNEWVNTPTLADITAKDVTIDSVRIIKDACSFDNLWDDDKHLPLLAKARVALGHTRWATQGNKASLANASPLLVGPLVGTHNGDVSTFTVRNLGSLPSAVGSTDTERLYQSLGKSRKDRRDLVKDLSAVEGRAALAWIDRYRSDRVYLARAALSPLAIAFDAEGNMYWASNPAWFRRIDRQFNGAIGFHSIVMVREGSLITVDVAGDAPIIEDMRGFEPTCRAADARLGDMIIWRGFDEADIAADKAQVHRKVAAPRYANKASTWKPSGPAKVTGTGTGTGWTTPNPLPSYADALQDVDTMSYQASPGQRTLDEALLAEQPDIFEGEYDSFTSPEDSMTPWQLQVANEVDSAVLAWADEGMHESVVTRMRAATNVKTQLSLANDLGLSGLVAYDLFRKDVFDWWESEGRD